LVDVNKIKGKRLSFKDKKLSFLFEPIRDSDIQSLSVFKVTLFDHSKKTFALLNTKFELEEKKKVIEGFYSVYHRIIQSSNSNITMNESYILEKDILK